jgi:hypothetical protein
MPSLSSSAPAVAGAVCLAGLAGFSLLAASPAAAGPVRCVTTTEAVAGSVGTEEVTRCAPVVTTPQLVEQRFHTWRATFESGVDVRHQITDLLGIAFGGGGDGRPRLMGFGFPDQAITWDGTALENTAIGLLDAQSDPMPLRTPDALSGINASLVSPASTASCPSADRLACAAPTLPVYAPGVASPYTSYLPVRGLW